MSARRRFRGRRGMTLVEMLIALTVFGVVMASAIALLRRQGRAFETGTEEMETLQNVRYAVEHVAQQLLTAGAGVPDQQPSLVYAGTDVVAFDGDVVTRVANDAFAVYFDPDAPAGSVSAPTPAQRFVVPNTTFGFPDAAYTLPGGENSPAETVVLFLQPDASTARTDDYVLYQSVNGQPAEEVARNLLRTPGRPFFEYLRLQTAAGGAPTLVAVPAGALPLAHTVPLHLAPADTGAAALVDSVRAVRFSVTGTNGLTGAAERTRTITRLIRLPNAGLATRKTCGDEPLPPSGFSATAGTLAAGEPAVTLAWGASVDEAGGEKDVVRYVIWRRSAADTAWGDPYLSIPGGNTTYTYTDAAVVSGEQLIYAVAAQDCTPGLSTRLTAGPVSVP